VTKGKLGEPPEDYTLFKAAQWMHIPPWVLLEQPLVWKLKALDYMSAEAEAEEELANRK
jgi:hypothetical protein